MDKENKSVLEASQPKITEESTFWQTLKGILMYLFFAFSYIPALWGGLGLFQACKDFFFEVVKRLPYDYKCSQYLHTSSIGTSCSRCFWSTGSNTVICIGSWPDMSSSIYEEIVTVCPAQTWSPFYSGQFHNDGEIMKTGRSFAAF